MDDETLIMADLARKAQRPVTETVEELLLSNGYRQQDAKEPADELSGGKRTHDYPIRVELAQAMGFTRLHRSP